MRSTPMSIARFVQAFALAAAVGAGLGLGFERLTNSRSDADVSWLVALVTALATAIACAVDRFALPASARREERAADLKKREACDLLGIDARNLGYYFKKHRIREDEVRLASEG